MKLKGNLRTLTACKPDESVIRTKPFQKSYVLTLMTVNVTIQTEI